MSKYVKPAPASTAMQDALNRALEESIKAHGLKKLGGKQEKEASYVPSKG